MIVSYGIAVNWASGDVYVSEFGNSNLETYAAGAGGNLLTIEVGGECEGPDISSPAGIECGTAGSGCEQIFEEEVVELSASPEGGCSGTFTCKVDGGSEEACAAENGEGHVVKLKEIPGTHFPLGGRSEFAGSGTVATHCTGVVTECEVKMDADVTGKAMFTENKESLTIIKVGTGAVECEVDCKCEVTAVFPEGGARGP